MIPVLNKAEWVNVLPSLKLGNYILKRQRMDGSFGNLEETFWAVYSLANLKNLESIDKDSLLKFILSCKRINGFAPTPHDSEIDLHSIFYAINILFLINRQNILSIEEFETIYHNILNFQSKDGGFIHCNLDYCPCKGKASLKSTFFAITCLKILYEIRPNDEKRILNYLSRHSQNKEISQVFQLLSLLRLDHIEDISEPSINNLINLQQTDGSFGSLEYSFWALYCLDLLKRLRNINKGKLFEYIRSHQIEDTSFSIEKALARPDQQNIKDTAWATISITILWNELVNYIENKLLIQIYTNDKIFIEDLAESLFVRSDLLIYLINNLMKYDWFNVEIRDSVDIIKDYIKNYEDISRRIAVSILKYIADQNFVNLSELANLYSSGNSSQALELVIKVANDLIEKKLIIGEIKWHKRFFRVTGFLHGALPGKILVRLNQIPYHEVTIEKEQVPVERKRIEETIDRIKPLTEKIRAEIDNLLDINEVKLAKEHLKEDITTALEILNSSNSNIETNISKFQYLNGEYSQFLMRDWVGTFQKTKEEILKIEKEYIIKIKEKERIVQILTDLENFQDFVQDQLNNITNELNYTLKLFQEACEESNLERKKNEILDKLTNLSISVERITPQLQTQATNLSKVSIELRRTQESSHFDALQPLEKWLESMWMKKRKNTLKIINDLKSQLNAREELKENIQNRQELFKFKLKELSNLIDSKIDSTQFTTATSTLNEKTEDVLKYISESNQYILNFIQDTSSYLEGFQLTVDDIFQEWSKTTLENMRNELNNVKRDLEEKILSTQELDKNKQLNTIIEKNISELKNAAESMEKDLYHFVEMRKFREVLKEIKQRTTGIEELIKICNREIQNYIKKTSQDFINFPETSQVNHHKWSLFTESFRRNLSLISDKVQDQLLIKIIFALAPVYHGGRIKLDGISSRLSLKKDEIEDRIIYLISVGKLEGQYDKDKEEIIPMTEELKTLLDFERMMKDEMESLKTEYERTKRLFETSCRKKQLDDKVTGEIMDRTRDLLSKKYRTEISIDNQVKQLPHHIDLQILLEKWYQQKSDLEQTLASIKLRLTKRREFKDKTEQYLARIHKQFNEIVGPIDNKLQSQEYHEAKKLLSKSISQMESEIKKLDTDLFISVDKISNDLTRFDLVVADILNHWSNEKRKLKTDLSDLQSKLHEKINEGLVAKYKVTLNELIRNGNLILTNFIDKYEHNVELNIEKGDIAISETNLQNFHKKFDRTTRDCQRQIDRFISSTSKSIKTFKEAVEPLTTRWELFKQETLKTYQETYLQLENQLLIKYLQMKQVVLDTLRLDIGTITSELRKLKLKKNELRQRLISLIAAEKLGGKLDPNTDEYIFPTSPIEVAPPERPPIIILPESTPKPIKTHFWDKMSDLLRKWYPIIGSFGSVAGASITIYSVSGMALPAILLPSIVFPTLFIYVLYKHYKGKN